jgi:hypothetical protein
LKHFLFLSLFSVAGTRKCDFDFSNKETIISAVIWMFFLYLSKFTQRNLPQTIQNKAAQKPADLNRNNFISCTPIFISAVHMLKSEVLVLFFLKCPETFNLYSKFTDIVKKFILSIPPGRPLKIAML